MSPVLDATNIQDENELSAELAVTELPAEERQDNLGCGPLRRVVLEVPSECETQVTLFAQLGPDNLWRSGYQIVRNYDVNPHEADGLQFPSYLDATEEYCVESIGEAVCDAADMAEFWLSQNSDCDDEKAADARDWIRQWSSELYNDQESVTEAIFEVLSVAEVDATPPAATEQATETDAAPADKTELPVGVTEEAQRDFEERKRTLEGLISKLAIEQVRLKAATKLNRERLTDSTEELEKHLLKGPERLPLFDRQQNPPATSLFDKTDAAEAASEDADAVETEAAATSEEKPAVSRNDEGWRSVSIEDVGIDPKICKILREDNDIGTLGQIADHTGQYELTDLKKIGQAKADKIEEALAAYWAANPRE